MKLNKASVLINKVKGVNNAIALIKHSFRETKENKGNIFESKTENNLYWIQDKLFNSDENKKTVFMKDLLLKNTDIVKLEFEKTMAKTKISRRQTWESYSFNKYIMQEVLINISPAWWEEQKLVSYHEEKFYNELTENIDKYKWGISCILNKEKLQKWGESQIDWMKQELKDTYGNDKNYLGASLHLDEKTPHIHIFLSVVDFSFDKRKGRDVFKLSTAPLTENRFNVLQTSIWNHNQKHFDKNLARGIYRSVSGYNYKSLSEFRTATNLKMINAHLEIKQVKEKWLGQQQSWILNNSKIKEIMRDMLVYKSVDKESEYLAAKHELEKLGLNIDQTNDIEQYVERIMERSGR